MTELFNRIDNLAIGSREIAELTMSSREIAELTMSSREIAELTGKEHRNVLRDIRAVLA